MFANRIERYFEMAANSGGSLPATIARRPKDINEAAGAVFSSAMDDYEPKYTCPEIADAIECADETISRFRRGFVPDKSSLFDKACRHIRIDPTAARKGQLVRIEEPAERIGVIQMVERLLCTRSAEHVLFLVSAAYKAEFGEHG